MEKKNGFVDLGCLGPKFTWSNNRHGHNQIRERLNKGLANIQWTNLFPLATITTLAQVTSDHVPILLNTSNCNNLPKSFKFEKFWTRDPSSLEISQTHPILISLETDLKTNINELLLREESFWKQKSRITWLTTTDLNTKFFHASTAIRRRRNRIDNLKIGRNQWTLDTFIITSKIQEHFQNIYTSSQPPSPENLDNLKLPNTKALGPDAFIGVFYKTYWEVIKADLIAVVQNFFIHGKLLKELNYTNLALIPKNENPNDVHQFRLISLSNLKLQSWKAKIISQAAKTVLIRAVASAIPCYTMATNLLPK
ncbi:hypothetical protein CIPAW_09G139300 [Carya illinoinensis]|uniref:Reverse transcriptase n=1 Tax=Carya illinoinensis TaxID=32201 RepID=A0A8T1PCR4_CARIL|nr:hypothetical protein CIPAW_09G139300 [Carya illinoinensis]